MKKILHMHNDFCALAALIIIIMVASMHVYTFCKPVYSRTMLIMACSLCLWLFTIYAVLKIAEIDKRASDKEKEDTKV